jgi:nucleotide-binding universal stress UspA family protein
LTNTQAPKAGHGQVLVAVDGSPASLEALRHGQHMAELLGDALVAVSAWQPFRHGVLPPSSTDPEQASEDLITNSLLASFRGANVPKVKVVIVEGDPAENLIRLSVDADLLVIGSRGHSGVPGMLLGSVSTTCAAHAHCPVLVVHAPTQTHAPQARTANDDSAPTADQRIVVTF